MAQSPPVPSEPRWFYARNRQKFGPVGLTQLKQLAAAGQLQPTDMLLPEGSTTWTPASSLAGLFAPQPATVAMSVRVAAPPPTPPPATTAPPVRVVPAAAIHLTAQRDVAPETVPDAQRTGPYVSRGSAPASAPRTETAPPLPTIPGYEILGVLGRGGMGVVYKARQLSLKRVVALKMILSREHAGPQELARFQAEAEAVARLQHPNIVQIYEVGEHDGRPYFSLEFAEGGSLSRKLAGTPLPPVQAAQTLTLLAGAMQAAHQRGIVHRDLKPANVLLAADGTPKIADFGLAKQLDDAAGQTQTGQVVGTPSYMAPEQAWGKNPILSVGPGVDVYALGAILYELLTGRPPFKAATIMETLEQVRSQEPVPVRQLQPKTPRDLETICLKCLEKEPQKRYSSAQALAEDLGRFLAQKPIVARPPNPFDRAMKFTRRNKILVGGVAAVVAALLLGMLLTSIESSRARRAKLETAAKAAQIAAGRGDHRKALALYEEAIKGGYPKVIGLRLERAKAWIAVYETRTAALEELTALSQQPDLGEYEGRVLLYLGTLHLGPDTDKALKLIRQALDKKLPPAEEAYALGLLAETSSEAVAHFLQTLKEDRFHQQARGMLSMLLILLGRHDEARDHIKVGALLFPEDPTFTLHQASLKALGGDLAGAHAVLEKALPQLGAEQVAALKAGAEALYEMHDLDHLLADPTKPTAIKVADRLMPHLGRFLPAGVHLGDEKSMAASARDLQLHTPPLISRGLGKMTAVLATFMAGKLEEGGLETLGDVLKVHPEGTAYFFRGGIRLVRGQFAEAEPDFVKAAEVPSMFKTRRLALFCAVICEVVLAFPPGKAPDEVMAKKTVANLRQLVDVGVKHPFQFKLLVPIATKLQAFDLGRRLLDDWERLQPENLEVLLKRAELELAAGGYALALQATDRALARQPGEPQVTALRAVAVQQLRDLLKKVGP